MARRWFWAEKFRMPVHSAPVRPFATCSVHDQSSGSDFRSQYAIARSSGMRSPRGRGQHLDFLGREQRSEFHGKALDEILVGEHRRPVRATIGVVVELPQMDELVDHARVGLEVADQLLVLAALLE